MPEPGPIKLCNYADMVKGHYCVGRLIEKGRPYWEFWNESKGGSWCSAGTVYYGHKTAKAKLDHLQITLAAAEKAGI